MALAKIFLHSNNTKAKFSGQFLSLHHLSTGLTATGPQSPTQLSGTTTDKHNSIALFSLQSRQTRKKSYTVCLCTATIFSLVTEGQDRRKCKIICNTNPLIWEKRERTVLPAQTGKGALNRRLLFIPLYILEEKPGVQRHKRSHKRGKTAKWGQGTSFPATQPSGTGGHGHRGFEWPQGESHRKEV